MIYFEKENDFILGEKFSNNYYARNRHIKDKTIPTITEIKKTVGSLQPILQSQLSEDTKHIVGYEPKLPGPGDQLWIPPCSDLSVERKLCPVTIDHIKALTHHGVLEIGGKVFKHVDEHNQEKIKDAITKNDELWKWIVKDECRKAVENILKKEKALQENEMNIIITEYSKIHDAVIKSLENQYHFKLIADIDKSNEKLKNEMNEEIKNALNQQKQSLQLEYENKLEDEKRKMREHFDVLLEKNRAQFSKRLQESTKTLRYQLECRGMADVLYTACSERHHYLMKKSRAEKYFNEKYDQLATQLQLCEQQLQETELKYATTAQHEQKLKDHVAKLCKMMRKFLAYQFKVPPSQLGYLPVFESLYNETIDDDKVSKDKDTKNMEVQDYNNVQGDDIVFWKNAEKQHRSEKKPFLIYGGVIDDGLLSKNVYGSSTSSEEIIPELEPSASELSTVLSESKLLKDKETEKCINEELLEKLNVQSTVDAVAKPLLRLHRDSLTLIKDKTIIVSDSRMTNISELPTTDNIYGHNLPPYMSGLAHESFDDIQGTYGQNENAVKTFSNIDENEELSELNLKIPSFHVRPKSTEEKIGRMENDGVCSCQLHSKTCCNITKDADVNMNIKSSDSLKEKDVFKVLADDESWKHLERSPEEFVKYTQETLQKAFKRNPSLIDYFKEKRTI